METSFGFAGVNSNSGTLTQYYDNVHITITNSVSIGGSVTGETGKNVSCQNLTTKQSIVIKLKGATSWNCQAAGLVVNSGDLIKQVVNGKANFK